MNNARLKSQIVEAVGQSWPQFAADHPALARTIDQLALSDFVAETIAGDPEFDRAYRAAVEANVGAQAIGGLVRRFADVAIAKLL